MAVLSSFLSYLLLMLVILVVGAAGITIGIIMRKKKNAAEAVKEEAVIENE